MSELDLCRLAVAAIALWPELDLDPEVVAAYLADRDAARLAAASEDGLAELVLACACAKGDPVALQLFEDCYLDVVPPALAHMKLGASQVDEVRQAVREKLLLPGEDGARRLDQYAGQGKLRGLIKVAAVRTAISGLRKHKRERPLDDAAMAVLPGAGDDPELGYMKRRYRSEFKVAFEQAAAELSSRDRNLLRLHLLDGVTLEGLAEVYGVHRATVVRWLAKSRGALLERTRKHMRARLEVSPEELDSLMQLIQSRLDVSVRRVLQTRDD